MAGVGVSILYGLVGSIVGAIVVAIIMMLMRSKLKTTPPEIMAEKIFGDKKKKPIVLFMNFGIWGIIFGLVVSLGGMATSITNGLLFALVPWLVLGVIMLPMAGAGFFGSKRKGTLWILSLVMHLIWGIITVLVFNALVGLVA